MDECHAVGLRVSIRRIHGLVEEWSLDARTPESKLANPDVNFERFRVTASEAAITATIPRAEGIRPVVELFREAYPGTRFSVEWGDTAGEREPSIGSEARRREPSTLWVVSR